MEWNPVRIEFICSVDMIANDEIGQCQVEFDNALDYVLKVICEINVHKANKIQQIARKGYKKLNDKPGLIDKFEN
eukprot:4565467-Ditylum_brightwellii.AAC.1